MTTICLKCSKENPDESKFCAGCGSPVNGTSNENTSPPPNNSNPPPNYGHNPNQRPAQWKSEGTTLILTIVLGIFGLGGIGHIYLGNITRGIVITVVPIVAVYLGVPLSPNNLFSGTSEIDNILSGFPEQIQNIKREQILNCENNMGYLQSFELGEMIKEKCINGILGK